MSVLAAVLLAATSLHITVWPNGEGNPGKRVYTLRCAPVGGTLPHPASACTKLMRVQRPFAPVPKNTACTQIYGGPQIATVTGTFRGEPVAAEFSRTNGCEIERWDRVAFLFGTTT